MAEKPKTSFSKTTTTTAKPVATKSAAPAAKTKTPEPKADAPISRNSELLAKYKERVGAEEFDSKSDEFRNDAIELGFKEEDVESYLVKRWSTYLAKSQLTYRNMKHVTVQGVILNIQGTDYGAKKQYKEATDKYDEDPETAIREGYTNAEGTPLYRTKGFKKGKPINLDEITYQGFGAFKIDGGDDFVRGQITINDDLLDKVPLGKLCDFEGGLKQSDQEDFVRLSATKLTNFTNVTELGVSDLEELFTNYMPRNFLSVSQAFGVADELFEEKQQGMARDFNNFYIVKGQLAGDGVFFTREESTSDIMNLTDILDIEQLEGEIPVLTVWMPKDNKFLPRRIKDGAVDIFVIGVPQKSVDEQTNNVRYSISAAGIIVQPMFIAPDDAEEVGPEGSENNDEEGSSFN